MNKEYYPTQSYLEELREEGKFPYSFAASFFFKFALVFLLIYILKRESDECISIITNLLNGTEIEIKRLVPVFLFFPILLLTFNMISILFQSKFLIKTRGLINSPINFKIRWDGFLKTILSIFIILFFFILYIFTVYLLSGEFMSLLNNDFKSILEMLSKSLNKFLLIFIGLFLSLGVISSIINKFLFLYRNRMTRAQYESELRGQE